MGFFDEGGSFGDAFNSIWGTDANAAPGPNYPPGGDLAAQGGINDIGPQTTPVTAPPASSTYAPPTGGTMAGDLGMGDIPGGAEAAPPLPSVRPPGADMGPSTAGTSGSPYAGPPGGGMAMSRTLQQIPTSTGPTPPPIASSTTYNAPGGSPASQPAAGRAGLLDPVMRALGKNPDTPWGGGLFGDPRTARQFAGSLGAGLSAAGNSAGKSPAQAAFGGAGAAIQGGQKADDTGTEQQRKATASERENQRLAETQRRNDQTLQWHMGELARRQQVGTVQSRAQAWETSDYGRLQKANAEILKQQAEIRQNYRSDLNTASVQGKSVSGMSPDEIRTQMKKEQDEVKANVYKQYNVDPDALQKRGTAVFGEDGKIDSDKTKSQAHKPTSWDDFHATVKPGQYYINPSDGKLLMRKTPAPSPVDAGTTIAGPSFMTPPAATPDYSGEYAMAG